MCCYDPGRRHDTLLLESNFTNWKALKNRWINIVFTKHNNQIKLFEQFITTLQIKWNSVENGILVDTYWWGLRYNLLSPRGSKTEEPGIQSHKATWRGTVEQCCQWEGKHFFFVSLGGIFLLKYLQSRYRWAKVALWGWGLNTTFSPTRGGK